MPQRLNDPMTEDARKLHTARRYFFKECSVGVGKIALASLLTDAFTAQTALAQTPQPAHPMPMRM